MRILTALLFTGLVTGITCYQCYKFFFRERKLFGPLFFSYFIILLLIELDMFLLLEVQIIPGSLFVAPFLMAQFPISCFLAFGRGAQKVDELLEKGMLS